ncbi:MAG: WYL domain-containing protein [Chitinispirillaceae bacterium]|nr:WYL domain-containing protein [Chitinispirillaceae bacterium]
MDKWEKVLTLHRLLSSRKYTIPLDTILNEIECSEATFHRLRCFLQDRCGAPIVFDRRYGGYHYDTSEGASFELPGLWFSHDEIEALLCFDSAVESLQPSFFREMFEPLKKRFGPALKAQRTSMAVLRERIKILSMASRSCDPEIFRTIASAVVRRRRIIIGHRTLAANSITERTVSPQTLVRYRDNWYLDAYCHLRKSLRTFALNRIEKAAPTPGKWQSVPEDRMKAFFADAYGIFTGKADKKATINFFGLAARDVSRQEWHPKQQGRWIDEKTYRLTVPYGHDRELLMDVLKWGDEARIVSPASLRNKALAVLSRTIKYYKK